MAAAPLPTFEIAAKAIFNSVSALRIAIGYPTLATFDEGMPHGIFDSFIFGWGVDSADQIGYLLEFCRRVVQAGIEHHMPISNAIKSAALIFDKVITTPDSMAAYTIDKGFTVEKLKELREKSEEYLKLTHTGDMEPVLEYLAWKRRGPAVSLFASLRGQEGGKRRRRRHTAHRRSHKRRILSRRR